MGSIPAPSEWHYHCRMRRVFRFIPYTATLGLRLQHLPGGSFAGKGYPAKLGHGEDGVMMPSPAPLPPVSPRAARVAGRQPPLADLFELRLSFSLGSHPSAESPEGMPVVPLACLLSGNTDQEGREARRVGNFHDACEGKLYTQWLQTRRKGFRSPQPPIRPSQGISRGRGYTCHGSGEEAPRELHSVE